MIDVTTYMFFYNQLENSCIVLFPYEANMEKMKN